MESIQMIKGILASAISISLLATAGCSSENETETKADATQSTIAAVSDKANPMIQAAVETTEVAAENVAETSASAIANVKGVVDAAANKTTAAVTGVAAAVAAPKILKDENGNVVITQELIDSKVQASRETVKAFGKALKGKLVAAMEEGGPVNALGVCNIEAPEIARQVSTDRGVKVSRVSLKNRSLMGEPSEWQTTVMNDFEARKAAGEDAGKLEFSEVVEYDGKSLLRYMKAIPAGQDVCMKCHGTNIAPDVQAKLNELYPNDKATGFSVGDIRGAFVVLQPM